MAIYDILSTQRVDEISSFNGYLEDYLNLEEKNQMYLDALETLYQIDKHLKVCVDLRLSIHAKAVANQIIRYKDAFKLPEGSFVCPCVVYGKKEERQFAMLLTYGNHEAYLYAKALYYVISEPDNMFEGTRNEILALAYGEDTEFFIECARRYIVEDASAGLIQRGIDRRLFASYEQMYETAAIMAESLKEHVKEHLDKNHYEQSIYLLIAKWYLLKKFCYVQYMMDKHTLNTIHQGNLKKQRQMAKAKCDQITFVSFSQMWRMKDEIEKEAVQ